MSAQTITRRLTQAGLAKLYSAGEKVTMFTCYDASFARLLDGAGVETLLIGDSLAAMSSKATTRRYRSPSPTSPTMSPPSSGALH